MSYNPTLGEKKAIDILDNELNNWRDDIAFVTDVYVYEGLECIKKARKNYFGIFDEEYDPRTNRKKIFIPLTEWTVETVLKNIDIDTKDIQVKALKPDSYKVANVFRYVLRYYLDKLNFGKILNDLLRNVVIDGTAFLKIWVEDGKVKARVVDRLNMTVDPTAPDLKDTPIIERNLLTEPEFKEYDWDNMEYVEGVKSLDRTGLDVFSMSNQQSQVPYVEVFERYGYLPKMCFTNNIEDKDYVYGMVCYSSKGSSKIVHKLKEMKEEDMPYQEFKFRDLVNRFDGRGVPEMLFQIQAYLNEIINIRLNTARVSQSGLWEVRGNITPQQLKRLFTTGAIKTSAEGDIAKIDTGSIDPSSYKDEEQAYMWAQRATQTQAEDEITPVQPATNALIQERGSAKGYNLVMEGVFINLRKVLKEKLVPAIRSTIKPKEIVRITGDTKSLESLDEQLVENYMKVQIAEIQNDPEKKAKMEEEIVKMVEQGVPLEQAEEQFIEKTKAALMEGLKSFGEDRFPEVDKKIFDVEFDIDMEMGDEQINKGVMVNQLVQVMGMLGQMGQPIDGVAREIFDALGLDAEKLIQKIKPQPPEAMGLPEGVPATGQPVPSAQPVEANQVPQPV